MPQDAAEPTASHKLHGSTGGVPLKFNQDGEFQPFAGNTIICHLPEDDPLQTSLKAIYADLEAMPVSSHYGILPIPSFHMTVFEGICDKIRKPRHWPSDLSINASVEECNSFFTQRLSNFDLGFQPPIRMSVTGFRSLKHGVSLHLQPVDDAMAKRLRDLRDRLSETLGLRQPGHDSYEFHLSIAYLVRLLNDDQAKSMEGFFEKWTGDIQHKEIQLCAPEFCVFDDMSAYRRQFYIGEAKGSCGT